MPDYNFRLEQTAIRQFSFGAINETLFIRTRRRIVVADLSGTANDFTDLPTEGLSSPNPSEPFRLEQSSDGHWLTANGRNDARIWNLGSPSQSTSFFDLDFGAAGLSFSPDKRWLVADT
jgi:hypothetical protein